MGKSFTTLLSFGVFGALLFGLVWLTAQATKPGYSASGVWQPVYPIILPATKQIDVVRETEPTLFLQQKECLAFAATQKEQALAWFKNKYNIQPRTEVVIDALCEERNGTN